MLDDGQPKDRNLAFSASSKSVNVYGKTETYVLTDAPTLSGKAGALDDVTYSITGDSGVASVASDGKVTLLLGTGTVTVKASASATDKWLAGEASYTLTVTNTAPPTYTLISGQSELVTGTYLIVSVNNKNKALKGGTGDGADRGAVVSTVDSPFSTNGNTITISGDASDYEYVITRTDNSITVNGKLGYLMLDRSKTNTNYNTTTYIGFEATVSSSSTFTVNTNPGTNNSGEDAVFFSARYDNSSDEYLYYNTNGYFKLGGSGKPSSENNKYGGVLLYKKN